jgi:hypothetical protein
MTLWLHFTCACVVGAPPARCDAFNALTPGPRLPINLCCDIPVCFEGVVLEAMKLFAISEKIFHTGGVHTGCSVKHSLPRVCPCFLSRDEMEITFILNAS